jgi:hypothetical protein
MDYKVKLTKCQNEYHHRGLFDTWTKWANPRPSRPGFELAQPRTWLTRLYVSSQGRIQGLKVVEAERSGRPAIHLLQTHLAMSLETPLCPYINPLRLKTQQHTLPCSSALVNVLV